MLELPTEFDRFRKRPHSVPVMVLVIYAQGQQFYFSDHDLTILDWNAENYIRFEPLVKSWGSIKSTIDLFTKSGNISNVKVNLINAPFKRSSGAGVPEWACLSDHLSTVNYVNRIAEIWIGFEELVGLFDYIKIFSGIIQPIGNVTPDELDLDLYDATFMRHKEIPLGYATKSGFPNMPPESEGKRFPLVFGDHILSTEQQGTLVEGVWVSGSKIIFSDEVLNEISQIWTYDENLGRLVRLDPTSYTVNLNDGGRGSIELISTETLIAHFYLYPNFIVPLDDDFYTMFTGPLLASDLDATTECIVTNPGLPGQGFPEEAFCRIDGYFNETFADAGPILNVYEELHFYRATSQDIDVALFCYNAGATPTYIDIENNAGGSFYSSAEITGYWAARGITWSSIGSSDNGANLDRRLSAWWDTFVTGAAEEICRVREMRLRIKYRPQLKAGWRIFAECRGIVFGSWIDAGGRSNAYNAGNLIKNPAHIVESILRNQLGLISSEIDVASFDAAGAALIYWDLAFALQEAENSKDVIEGICRQAKLNFFFNSQGLATIKVIDNSPTIQDDILSADNIDVRDGGLKLSSGDPRYLANKVTLSYRYWRPDSELRKLLAVENSASQSTYNIIAEKSPEAPDIAAASVAQLFADHFAGSSGFWKDLREILAIKMASLEKIHWEIGDLIKPDSSLNSILKKLNADWGTALMMITEKTIGAQDLSFKMMKVN